MDSLGYIFLFIFCLLVCIFIVVSLIVYIKKSVLEIKQMRLDYEREKELFY